MKEEDGRRRRKADTELKTKTPHVNVGKSNLQRPSIFSSAYRKQKQCNISNSLSSGLAQ